MLKILIVEDNKVLMKVLRDKLKREGFGVIEANDGEEAFLKISENKPDLILLDIIMPKMDGFTFLDKIKENEKLSNIPIILLTNLSDTDYVARGVGKGVKEYLIKSNWTIQDVVDKVKSKLGK